MSTPQAPAVTATELRARLAASRTRIEAARCWLPPGSPLDEFAEVLTDLTDVLEQILDDPRRGQTNTVSCGGNGHAGGGAAGGGAAGGCATTSGGGGGGS